MDSFSASASATFFYMSHAVVAVDTTQVTQTSGTKNLSLSAEGVRVSYRGPKASRR
ncbi:MAG: hypothetical protein ACT4TC_02785 [Myxococcaceae bacterium]